MKLVIATPIFGTPDSGSVSWAYHRASFQFARAPDCDVYFDRAFFSCDLVRARSRIVRMALEDVDMTHLLFWDADVAPRDLTVIPYMVESGKDMICFPYPRKRVHWEQVADAVRDEEEMAKRGRQSAADLESASLQWTTRTLGAPVGNLVRVLECGGGFTMVSRRMLQRLVQVYGDPSYREVRPRWVPNLAGDPYSDGKWSDEETSLWFKDTADGSSKSTLALFDLVKRDGEMAPEDYSFCYRWRDLGGEIWMVLPRSGDGPAIHVGNYAFGSSVVSEKVTDSE